MSNIMSLPSVGQFMGVSRDEIIEFSVDKAKRHFRVLLYGAYNAMGLIGPEFNGIAVLDEDNKAVVCDCICKEQSGYFGPSKRQIEEFGRVIKLPWPEFRDLVNKSERPRFAL